MAINMDSSVQSVRPREKFSVKLAKFAGKLFAGLAVGFGLIYLGNQFYGIIKWAFIAVGVAVLAGIALYGSALSGEVSRKLGPLPLGKSDRDLTSLPLYQGRDK
jgi:hypothetical protein